MACKKLTDAQKQFITGDNVNTEAPQQANTEAIAEISNDIEANLKQELFGDRETKAISDLNFADKSG